MSSRRGKLLKKTSKDEKKKSKKTTSKSLRKTSTKSSTKSGKSSTKKSGVARRVKKSSINSKDTVKSKSRIVKKKREEVKKTTKKVPRRVPKEESKKKSTLHSIPSIREEMSPKEMIGKHIVVRLRGKDGTFRYNNFYPQSNTLTCIQKFIGEQTGIPHDSFSIFTDAGHSQPFKRSMVSSLQNGQMLFYQYNEYLKSKQELEEEKKREERQRVGDGTDIENLGLKYKKKNWTLNEFLSEIDRNKTTVKAQIYPVCSSVKVDSVSGQVFHQFLREMGYQVHRCGYLIGRSEKGHWESTKKKKSNDDEEEEEGESDDDDSDDSDDSDDDCDSGDDDADDWSKKIKNVMEKDVKIMKFDPSANKREKSKDYMDTKKRNFKDVYVDAIYEPKQEGDSNGFVELNDPFLSTVDKVAGYLERKRVGYIFSYSPSKERGEFKFFGDEVIRMAKHQAEFGEEFVTLAVGVNSKTDETNFDAYQVSQQCVELYKKGLLKEHPTDKKKIQFTKKVEFNRKFVTEVDIFMFIIRVPIGRYQSQLFQFGFPVMNRETLHPGFKQDNRKVRGLLNKRKGKSFVQQISDFHLLLYLAKKEIFVVRTDFPVLCKGILTKSNSTISLYKEILNVHLNQN